MIHRDRRSDLAVARTARERALTHGHMLFLPPRWRTPKGAGPPSSQNRLGRAQVFNHGPVPDSSPTLGADAQSGHRRWRDKVGPGKTRGRGDDPGDAPGGPSALLRGAGGDRHP
jgi:hypothetical protein